MHTHTHTHTCTHTIYAHTHTCTHNVHTCTHTCARIQTCTHAHAHTHAHTHLHSMYTTHRCALHTHVAYTHMRMYPTHRHTYTQYSVHFIIAFILMDLPDPPFTHPLPTHCFWAYTHVIFEPYFVHCNEYLVLIAHRFVTIPMGIAAIYIILAW